MTTAFVGSCGGFSKTRTRRSVVANVQGNDEPKQMQKMNRRSLLQLLGGCAAASVLPVAAREVGSIPASGFVFKDYVNVIEFEDPKVKGVRLYISDFQRPITEKIQRNFFSDPSQAAVTCVKTGPIKLGADVSDSMEGEEVFNQSRSLLFKSINVRRIHDKEANTLVYISFASRLSKSDDENKSRFKSSLCAIPID